MTTILLDDSQLSLPEDARQEMLENWNNHAVGQVLWSETTVCRVWFLALKPGERFGFHRHDTPYFWTALSEGTSRSRYNTGEIKEYLYSVGETKHFTFEKGAFFIHDLLNIGDTELKFITVELLAQGEG